MPKAPDDHEFLEPPKVVIDPDAPPLDEDFEEDMARDIRMPAGRLIPGLKAWRPSSCCDSERTVSHSHVERS
jgi:hypothetical protein